MEPFVFKNESLLTIEAWSNRFPGLVAGITTKHGGMSTDSFAALNMGFHVGDEIINVCLNREIIAKHLDFPLSQWVGAEQTHDVHIRKISIADRGRGSISYDDSFLGTDGFYTNEAGILLTLCYADCVPLFFIAPDSRMIGAAHAGWKGTVGQIAREMIQAWDQEGISPEEIFVAIGPSICEKCYIVDDRVINFVENILEDVDGKPYNLINGNQYCLDLREVNRLLLIKAGVPEKNIVVTELCTSCDQQFFSHRRERGNTGRMLSFIGWKEI